MWVYREDTALEELERQLKEQLGRELTAKEKFYIALSQACISNYDQPRDEHRVA